MSTTTPQPDAEVKPAKVGPIGNKYLIMRAFPTRQFLTRLDETGQLGWTGRLDTAIGFAPHQQVLLDACLSAAEERDLPIVDEELALV